MLWRRPVSLATLVFRWALVGAATLLVFRSLSIALLINDLSANAGLSYLVAIPVYATVAGLAVRRRGRPVVEIHDRETDIIVGGFALVISVSAAILLAPGLDDLFQLWRVDLLLMWGFAVGAGILLFGLRRVIQYRLAWLVGGLIWPLPLRLIIFTVGGGLLITIAVVHLAVVLLLLWHGRRRGESRRWLVPLAAALPSVAMLPFLGYQQLSILVTVPPLTASLIGVVGWALRDRRRPRPLPPPPVVAKPLSAYGVLAVAVVLSVFLVPSAPVPAQAVTPSGLSDSVRPGDIVPMGWELLDRNSYPEQSVYFGAGSQWQRYRLQAMDADSGPEALDVNGTPRQAMLDVQTTLRPRTMTIFPVRTGYGDAGTKLSPGDPVDLGHGVTGTLYSGVDTEANLTWTLVSFTINLPAALVEGGDDTGQTQLTQRITVLLVDDHRSTATFPQPSGALLSSVRSTLERLVRGSIATEGTPAKTPDLAVEIARRVLDQRVAGR